MSISRRQFLKIGGGGVVAAVGTGLLGHKLIDHEESAIAAPVAKKAEEITYKHGVCGICEMNCAMTGKVEKGRLTKLEGKADRKSVV